MGLLDLLNPLLEKVKQFLGPLGKLIDFVKRFFDGILNLKSSATDLTVNIVSEVHEWKNFSASIPYRTGVVNFPKAVEQTRQLIDQIIAAWHALIDLGTQLKEQFGGAGENPADEAEQIVKDVEEGGLKDILTKFPKLAKGLEKILGFLAIVVTALETIVNVIDDLQTILDAITGIREEVEQGKSVFLQQKNPRKDVKLIEGGKLRIRVGNLH